MNALQSDFDTSVLSGDAVWVSGDDHESPLIRTATTESEATSDSRVSLSGSNAQRNLHAHVVRRPRYEQKRPAVWESILQSWEGRVIYNSPAAREFTAIISDRTNKNNPEEEVVIGYDHVLPSDVDLIVDGAVFFWNIGRYRKYLKGGKIGPSVNKFEIRFRRLPSLRQDQTDEILEISKRISIKIHGYKSAVTGS